MADAVTAYDFYLPDRRAAREVRPLHPHVVPSARPPRIQAMMERVAERHACKVSEIIGPKQDRAVMRARRECATMLRDMGWSYPRIGAILNREHSTVTRLIHGRHVQQKQFETPFPDYSGEWAI